MIAEYQVEKLRSKVSEKIDKYGYANDKKVSSHMFKDDRRWFKISVKVEELAIDKTNRTYAWERNFLISAKLYPVPFLPVKKRFGGK